MQEVYGDLWKWKPDDFEDHQVVRCVTTNGSLREDGTAVMGAGCAKEAVDLYPGIDGVLGKAIKLFGNHCFAINDEVIAFPVKHEVSNSASLSLIEQSAKELVAVVNFVEPSMWEGPNLEGDELCVVVPRPGCGHGGLRWEEVKPVIEPLFDDRFYVIHFAESA